MEKLPSGLWKIDTIFGSCLTGCGKVRRESPDPDDPLTKLFDKLWDEAKTDANGSSNAHPKTKKLENRTRMKRRTRFRGRVPSRKTKAQTPEQKNQKNTNHKSAQHKQNTNSLISLIFSLL